MGPVHCHYCEREADVSVEHEGVTVWLCEEHLREQVEALADAEWLDAVADELEGQ